MKTEELQDKVLAVLNAMEESIKKNTNDQEELERIQKIKEYLSEEEKV